MEDFTTAAPIGYAAGFWELFLLHELLAGDCRCFPCEAGVKVLLGEKLKPNLNPNL
jgi:hypothetical protein